MNSPHKPVVQIQREVDALKRKLQMETLPSIDVLEAELQRLLNKTILDEKFKPDAWQANQNLEAAKAMWQQRALDNTTLRQLETELDLAQQHERMERVGRSTS